MKKIITLFLGISLVLSGCSLFKKEAPKQALPKTIIRYYLPVDKNSPTFDKKLVPAGSLILSCGDYLTLRDFNELSYKDSSQLLEYVLASMFTTPSDSKSIYKNPTQEMGIRLDRVEVVDGKTNVYIQGEFVSYGLCPDAQTKMMIDKTVKLYADDYQIYLNDSADQWRCLYDKNCK